MSSDIELYMSRLRASKHISKEKQNTKKVITFKRALASSFNSHEVTMNNRKFQALVTGIPTSPQIDKKHFATLKDNGCEIGDEIVWTENGTHWLITDHNSSETSIFQASMQKALYELKWRDPQSGEEFSARACAKGPDESTVGDGVKHAIQFDVYTDSLYLIVSRKKPGTHLLKRYSEIMLNGKKWRIEVINEVTKPNLIYVQLIERPFNRDADTEDLVDGLTPIIFNVESSINNLTHAIAGSQISFEPILVRNSIPVHAPDYEISVTKGFYENGVITFGQEGTTVVRVSYPSLNQKFSWSIPIESSVSGYNLQSIGHTIDMVGPSTIKSLKEQVYKIIYLENGRQENIEGVWEFDTEFFEEDATIGEDQISLKAKNKTGDTEIKFITEVDSPDDNINKETTIKQIKIVPLFGGR